MISENSQSQRPTVVEEESAREEEEVEDLGFTKEELQEAEEIREKEVDDHNEVAFDRGFTLIAPLCYIHLILILHSSGRHTFLKTS